MMHLLANVTTWCYFIKRIDTVLDSDWLACMLACVP